MENYGLHETTSMQPDLEVGVLNIATARVANLGKIKEFTKPIEKTISLVGQSLRNNMRVKW